MTPEDFVDKLMEYAYLLDDPDDKIRWRRGQLYMNSLWDLDPELWKEVHGTEADCFFDDRRIPAFIAFTIRRMESNG